VSKETYSQEQQQINSGQLYTNAYRELKLMLQDSIKPDFKRAVFITENAYYDDKLSYEGLNKLIDVYVNIIKAYMQANPLPYKGSDYDNVSKNFAIYQFMSDTIWLAKDTALHYPYTYDFDDFACEKDWSGMFVSKLLQTHKGNCHSMPFLYKILADELGAEAYLSLAPYHMYIKTRSEKTGWFNTELTNGMFPVDAWVAASGYVTLEAMRSGIYMDTLSYKQSIAFCLYDLAKGCERKYGFQQFPFIFACLNLALEYYPNFINALIYKAECLKKRFDIYMRLYNAKDFKDILTYETPKEIYDEMQAEYVKILNLGFREMPPQMYHEWLMSLKDNKEKYQNNKILYILHSK
jgi:hypothetical protein